MIFSAIIYTNLSLLGSSIPEGFLLFRPILTLDWGAIRYEIGNWGIYRSLFVTGDIP